MVAGLRAVRPRDPAVLPARVRPAHRQVPPRRGEAPSARAPPSSPRARAGWQDADWDRIEALASYAEKRDLSLLDVAIAGLAAQPAVASVISGVSRGRAGAHQRRRAALGAHRGGPGRARRHLRRPRAPGDTRTEVWQLYRIIRIFRRNPASTGTSVRVRRTSEAQARTTDRGAATASSSGYVGALAGAAVLDLDVALDQPAADDDDGRHPDQLGVLELHPGADLRAVVVEHLEAGLRELVGERSPRPRRPPRPCRSPPRARRPAPPRAARPGRARRGCPRRSRHRPRDADAVGAHRDRDQLAVLVEHLQAERVGVLAPELEDVAHLDAAGGLQDAVVAVGAGVAVADLGASIAPSPVKSRPATRSRTWLPLDVRAGHPRGALDDARVERGSGCRRASSPPARPADVALGQRRLCGELGLGERLEHHALAELGLQPLGVDLAVAGHAERDGLGACRRGGAPRRPRSSACRRRPSGRSSRGERVVEVVDERVDRRGVGRLLGVGGGQVVVRDGGGRAHGHRLDVGGVVAVACTARRCPRPRGCGEELLGLRAAHGARHAP